MTSFEEKLVLLVKQKPCLYVKSSKEYKNAYKKDAVWTSIAEQLNKPVDKIKVRWRSLRDRFVSLTRKLNEESRSGAGAGSSPGWPLYNELTFLGAHMEARPTSSNYSSTINSQAESQAQIFTQEVNEICLESDPNDDENSVTTPTPAGISTYRLDTTRRRKREQDAIDSRMEHLLDTVQERRENLGIKRSKHEYFANYLACQLEQLPPQVARSLEVEFKTKVNSMIDEYEALRYEVVEQND